MAGANNDACLSSEVEIRNSRALLGLLWSKNRWTASANLAQFMVYRLQYGVLLVGWGEATLGVYSVAVVAAETLWLITQSYSTVLLSRLSSHRGEPTHSQVQQSWTWAKQALAWTVPAVLVLLLAPTTWLQALLGHEYASLTSWWWPMAPGILALAWSNVLIHHFTALGMVRVSFFSSLGSALLTLLGLPYAMDAGGVEAVALGWSLVLVLNAAAVGGYFLNRYRSYLWPPSG
jgi:O-antigen/teichoic acid export membrane protein